LANPDARPQDAVASAPKSPDDELRAEATELFEVIPRADEPSSGRP